MILEDFYEDQDECVHCEYAPIWTYEGEPKLYRCADCGIVTRFHLTDAGEWIELGPPPSDTPTA